jgi:hypothetical protein
MKDLTTKELSERLCVPEVDILCLIQLRAYPPWKWTDESPEPVWSEDSLQEWERILDGLGVSEGFAPEFPEHPAKTFYPGKRKSPAATGLLVKICSRTPFLRRWFRSSL